MDRTFSIILLVLTFTSSVVSSTAQTRPIAAPVITPELAQVTKKAGLIFTGAVVSVAPIRANGSEAISTVEVTFQVEQAIRGVRAGRRFTIREWSGLWQSWERYRVGQRMTLFLYPPSRAGLTSPVGGSSGRYDVDRSGQVLIHPTQIQPPKFASRPIVTRSPRVPLRSFSRAIRQAMEESQ